MTYCVKSPFVHTLAIIKIVLVVQGLEIVSPAARRVISVRVNTFPTTSCRIPGLNLPVTLIQCLFSCLSTFDLLHTFSQNVNTRECLCCKDPPSGTIHSFPGWISFSLICPTGYADLSNVTVRTCLRYVATPAGYEEAAGDCQQNQQGDLARIDSPEKYGLLQQFVQYHVQASEVWIQSRKEESNSTWRLHDGSILPEICPRTTSNTPNELHLRYIPGSGCLDHYPNSPFNYVCEVSFY